MPAPYLIGDERAFADYLTNANAVPQGGPPPGTEPLSKTALTAALSAISNTETLVINIPIIAGQTLQPGTIVRFRVSGTCTATVANTTTFRLRAGTAGTTADTSLMTLTTAASGTTATTDPFVAQIDFVVRTVGASGTGSASLSVLEETAGGIGGAAVSVVNGTTSALNTTTATFLDLTLNNAASTTAETVQQASIEIIS